MKKRRSSDRDVQGILVIDKEGGGTSHDLVKQARRLYRTSRVGHAGTLDPLASGVMVLLLGGATRAAEYVQEDDKEYRVTLLLGRETDTQDVTGATLAEADAGGVSRVDLEKAAAALTGTILQTPPVFSAIKVDGQPLYRRARKGTAVAPPARQVTISRLDIESFAPPRAVLAVSCSKGTYMRTLCHDLGRALGVGGCLEALARTRSGPFTLADAVPFSRVALSADPDLFLRETASALPFPCHAPGPGELAALSLGRSIPWEAGEPPTGGMVSVVSGGGLVALGVVTEEGGRRWLAPRKYLAPGAKELCKIEEKC